MSGLLPAAVYGLEVPSGDVMIPAIPDFPASTVKLIITQFRITMAAIDPSAEPEFSGTATGDSAVRATLKLVRQPMDMEDDEASEGDSDEDDFLQTLLNGVGSEDEHSSSDEEKNGGPSDPTKTKKARKEAAIEQLKKALLEDDDDDMDVDGTGGTNGIVAQADKGKVKATGNEQDDSEEDDSEDLEIEEFVLCTLDPSKNYQQPLDITIGEDERVFFKVSGTHTIYLTGNYVIPVDDGHNRKHEIYDDEDDEEEYDLSPDEDELEDDEESDELDALEDPRITEVDSEDEADAPRLVKSKDQAKKGKNKRTAADSENDETAGLDDIMAKSLKPEAPTTNGETKLSKKQLKKLKNNAGQAVAAKVENKDTGKAEPSTESPNAKKVQFAKDLEQGPSTVRNGTTDKKAEKKEDGKDGEKPKASLGVKTVQGVKIDDKKLGSGPAAKKGDKVGMRYIGKLQEGKVFDSNKKGKPFSFKLGAGDVIKGWDIGVAGMSIGGERRITIPAALAYGNKDMPGIPRNSPLVFDVKLLEIQ